MPGAGNAAAVPHKSRIATTDWQDSAIRNYLIKIAIIVIKAKYNVLGEPIRVSKCVWGISFFKEMLLKYKNKELSIKKSARNGVGMDGCEEQSGLNKQWEA